MRARVFLAGAILWGAAASSAVSAAPATAAATLPGTPPTTTQAAEELQARYLRVLGLLKSPPVNGVLVTDVGPRADAGATGLEAGDIITSYNQQRVATEEQLAEALAEAIADEAAHPLDAAAMQEKIANGESLVKRVEMTLYRGGKTITLKPAVGGLGATIRGVEAGVAAPMNPAPTPREQLVLAWEQVPTATVKPGQVQGHQTWLRVYDEEVDAAVAQVEHRELEHVGEKWTLTLRSWSVEDGKVAGEQRCRIVFAAGNHKDAPAVTLESVELAGYGRKTSGQRKGDLITGTVEATEIKGKPQAVSAPTVAEAVPGMAVETVAAALPHQAGMVLPVAVVNELDLRTRLGYALQSLGKQKVKIHGGTVTQAWGVRVWHFGRVETTLWFDDESRLVQGEYFADQRAEAVGGEQAAFKGVKRGEGERGTRNAER